MGNTLFQLLRGNRGGRGGRGGQQGMTALGKSLKMKERDRKGIAKKWGQRGVCLFLFKIFFVS